MTCPGPQAWIAVWTHILWTDYMCRGVSCYGNMASANLLRGWRRGPEAGCRAPGIRGEFPWNWKVFEHMGVKRRLQICHLCYFNFQGSLLADADAPRGWGVARGVCAVLLSLFVLLICFVNIHSGCFKSNHQPRREGGIVFTNVRLCVCPDIFVCQHSSVTPEPLRDIITRFSGPHAMGKREAMFENGYIWVRS